MRRLAFLADEEVDAQGRMTWSLTVSLSGDSNALTVTTIEGIASTAPRIINVTPNHMLGPLSCTDNFV